MIQKSSEDPHLNPFVLFNSCIITLRLICQKALEYQRIY